MARQFTITPIAESDRVTRLAITYGDRSFIGCFVHDGDSVYWILRNGRASVSGTAPSVAAAAESLRAFCVQWSDKGIDSLLAERYT